MTRKWLLALAAIVLSTAAMAQTPAPRRYVAIGCVSLEAGTTPTFILTDSRGEKPSKFKLDGDSQQLRMHVGHLLEIAGPISSDRPVPVVKVQSLTYLSPRCQKVSQALP